MYNLDILNKVISESAHKECLKDIPPIVHFAETEVQLTNLRQMFMQLHDKGLVSTKTLLAAFFLDGKLEKTYKQEEGSGPRKPSVNFIE